MKFGKLSNGHRTGKGQFLFQSPKRAMPKDVQTTAQWCLFHMLARLCPKSFKLGFSSTWIKNFQIYTLDLEKAEEPEIKLPTFVGSKRKQGNSRKTSVTLTTLKTDCENHNKLWKILKEMGIPGHLTYLWIYKKKKKKKKFKKHHVHMCAKWLMHVNVWQKPLKYCKVISLQLK